MRKIHLFLALTAAASAVVAQDRGLTAPTNGLGGTYWQARFESDATTLPASRPALVLPNFGTRTLRLFGDYQFSKLRLGETGGLRLTGGLLINLRTGLNIGGNLDAALPYAGIGYSSGNHRGEWGFSADLGLTSPSLASWRLDRLLNGGGLTVDGAVRLQPMVRLGMNVAF